MFLSAEEPLGSTPVIYFVIVSSDLRPYVLDIWVKKGAKLQPITAWW